MFLARMPSYQIDRLRDWREVLVMPRPERSDAVVSRLGDTALAMSTGDLRTKRDEDRVKEVESALARSQQRVAELLAEIDATQINSRDAEEQIRVARENATDAERQIVAARAERLRLLEEVETWRNRALEPGFMGEDLRGHTHEEPASCSRGQASAKAELSLPEGRGHRDRGAPQPPARPESDPRLLRRPNEVDHLVRDELTFLFL